MLRSVAYSFEKKKLVPKTVCVIVSLATIMSRDQHYVGIQLFIKIPFKRCFFYIFLHFKNLKIGNRILRRTAGVNTLSNLES